METAPPQYAVKVQSRVPLPGFGLEHDETTVVDGVTVVHLTLWQPEAGTPPPTVLSIATQRVALTAPLERIRVVCKRKQHGAHYFVEPPYEPVALLTRP